MALKQHAKGFTDDLNKLTEQQLLSFLEEELDSEDVNVELIKNITDVLAAKTNAKPIDAETAYRQFMSQYADTDPLYKDMEQELSALEEDEASPEADVDDAPDRPRKVVRFSRLAKFGILVAAVLVLFLAVSVVASAMGFNIWRAAVTWDKDNIDISSVSGEIVEVDDPLQGLRNSLAADGYTNAVVPYYLPDGYNPTEINNSVSALGKHYDVILQKDSNSILLSYSIPTSDYNSFIPRDDTEPEIYSVHGIEHYIILNEGKYGAFWSAGDVVCTISGVEAKEELLLMINSIYEG